MNTKQKHAFNNEFELAKHQFNQKNYNKAFYHLERAHILGQRSLIAHSVAHWWMLKVGWKQRSFKEVTGQISRIIAAIIFTRFWVPKGNTGGSNVSPIKPMPIPDDLKSILD